MCHIRLVFEIDIFLATLNVHLQTMIDCTRPRPCDSQRDTAFHIFTFLLHINPRFHDEIRLLAIPTNKLIVIVIMVPGNGTESDWAIRPDGMVRHPMYSHTVDLQRAQYGVQNPPSILHMEYSVA